jgi:GNAT superfamily N-acetyltransferase
VVGRGQATPRPDGRVFLSIDVWRAEVVDRLADVMLADVPRPLYTVVDEADVDLTCQWLRAGFTTGRREWEYVLPTDPAVTGLDSASPPPDVTILPTGAADEVPLRALDRRIRDEVGATVGWDLMPVELLARPDGSPLVEPSRYAVAAESGRYVGLVRLAPILRQPRIGLIAVLAGHRRRGIARALLAHVLGSLHVSGIASASADVHEANEAAVALFDGVGARRASSNLELVLR